MDVLGDSRLVAHTIMDVTAIRGYDGFAEAAHPKKDLSIGGFFALFATTVVTIVLAILIQYSLGLVLTLASVESPPTDYLPLDSDEDKLPQTPASPETPITSSIRGTIKHLRKEAGTFSPWRGWNINVMIVFIGLFMRLLFTDALGWSVFARIIAGVMVPIMLARLAMVCTHIMISRPGRAWYMRLFYTPWYLAWKTIPSVAASATASQFAIELSHFISTIPADRVSLRIVLLFVNLLAYLVAVLFGIVLIRVQASLLPDDQEAIVPFDRSFGITKSTEGVTFTEAWKSVGCKGWVRLGKVMAKIIPLAVVSMLVVTAGAELLGSWASSFVSAIVGPNI